MRRIDFRIVCLKADNATLTVNVENQNDNTPMFVSSSYTYSVKENQVNSVIGTVSVSNTFMSMKVLW